MMKTRRIQAFLINFPVDKCVSTRFYATTAEAVKEGGSVRIKNVDFKHDDYTNVTPKILSHLDRNLHMQKHHPLSMVRQRIVNYFYKRFSANRGNPEFSVYTTFSPVVSTDQNFDSLLIPKDHPSRKKSDCYYINRKHLLRAHTTCHQSELIRSGLNNFLVIGDVYRRDEIDSTHYPVFHQVDAVRLRTKHELFTNNADLELFEEGNNTQGRINI